jgi:DNA repair exonuclease SbcCD nuclease subunit
MRIVFSSDWHIGLRTDDIDRTDEIINIGKDIVKHCVGLQKEGYEVMLVLGGDLFNINTPSEKDIASFISVLAGIKKYEIKTIVIVGNHESVADPDRLSCLNFLKEIKTGYPTITLIDDIKFMDMGVHDTGPLYFTFLPHITRATVHRKFLDKKIEEKVTPQEYIDMKCERIMSKVGRGAQHIVFSHLNVKGCHAGSEDTLLKKSDVYLPNCFTNTPVGFVTPLILQGHIHSHSVDDNLNIVGSPIYCTFGESGNKYFAEIDVSATISEDHKVIFHRTKCKQFEQLELNMIGETRDFFDIPEVTKFCNNLTPEMNPMVKFDITINPESNHYDWSAIAEKMLDFNAHCRPIVPRVIFKRQVRSVEQKIGLSPKESVKVYLKKNLRKEKERAQRIYSLSQKYLEA